MNIGSEGRGKGKSQSKEKNGKNKHRQGTSCALAVFLRSAIEALRKQSRAKSGFFNVYSKSGLYYRLFKEWFYYLLFKVDAENQTFALIIAFIFSLIASISEAVFAHFEKPRVSPRISSIAATTSAFE